LADGCNPVWRLAKKLSNARPKLDEMKKAPQDGGAVKLCEIASIRKFCAVLFSVEQANRCRHQSGGREGLRLREGQERREHFHLDCYCSAPDRYPHQPTLERSVPSTGPSG
jgi:hypothetical protein